MILILRLLKSSLAKKHLMINIVFVIITPNLTITIEPPLLKVHPNIDVRLLAPYVLREQVKRIWVPIGTIPPKGRIA